MPRRIVPRRARPNYLGSHGDDIPPSYRYTIVTGLVYVVLKSQRALLDPKAIVKATRVKHLMAAYHTAPGC